MFVSRLAREKNVDVLVRAVADANDPSLVLVIAGDGPQRDELERLAIDLRIADRVVFLGVVASEELPDLYASADAFVFPSTTETQGLVQAEALAAGALVIAADTQPNREVLGDAARIVAPDRVAFAHALREVPAAPDAAASRRAKSAASRFSAVRQVDAMIELYESLLEPRPVDETNIRSVS